MVDMIRALPLAVAISVASPAVYAAFGYDAEYRADYTDNLFRVDDGEEKTDELTHNVRLGLFGNHVTSWAKTDFLANIEYKDYQDDLFEDEALISFLGASEIAITPRVFSWYIADALGYADNDTSLAVDTRDAERVNYFITGPQAKFTVGAEHELGANLYYTHHDREDEDGNYQRVKLSSFYDKFVSSRSNWGLTLDHTEMMFDESARRVDYSHSELRTYYAYNTKADSFDVSVGASYLQTDVSGADSDTTATMDVSWNHLFTRRAGVVLSAGYNLSDESVLSNAQLNESGEFATEDENGLFYETSAGISYYYKGVMTRMDIGVEGRALDYIEDAQTEAQFVNDHNTYLVFATVDRALSNRVTASLGVSAEQKDYTDEDFEEALYTVSAEAVYQLNRNLTLKAEAEYELGDGDVREGSGAFGEREYEEHIYSIGLHWDPFRSRRNDDKLDFFDLSIIN